MLKRTVNRSSINLASNRNKCMLPNGERRHHHNLFGGGEGIGSNNGQINYHISRGFVKISKGHCFPQAVP